MPALRDGSRCRGVSIADGGELGHDPEDSTRTGAHFPLGGKAERQTMQRSSLLTFLLGGLAMFAAADASPTTSPRAPREVRLEGSLSQRTGNTDKLSYTYGLTASVGLARHGLAASLRAERSKNKGQPSDVDNLRVDLMDNWGLSDAIEPYAKITYYRNVVWGFRRQIRAGCGLVQGWWATSRGPAFRTRLGYQFRSNRFTRLWSDAEGAKPGERQHCLLLGGRTQVPLMRNISLSVSGDYEPVLLEGDNYYADLNASLTFVVNDRVRLIASSDAAYQRIPVPGKKQRNTESSFRLSVRI